MKPRLAAVIAASLLLSLSGTGRAQPTFTLHDTGTTGSEVTLGIDAQNRIFAGGWSHIARSDNLGTTWTAVPNTFNDSFQGDRMLIVDRATGRVFVDDTTLACTILKWSSNRGATWSVNPIACGGGVTDHEKAAVGKRTKLTDPSGRLYPNIVYVCANGLVETPCAVSLTGGSTFLPSFPAGAIDIGKRKVNVSCAFQGQPIATPNGTLYQPIIGCGAEVTWTTDNGLTWHRRTVSGDASADAPDIAVTPDGTLYYFWTSADFKPRIARSTDGGNTWPTFAISAPGLVSSAFPVVAGGNAAGQLGLAFYGTTDNPAGWNHNPGDAPAGVKWQLYTGVVSNANSATPAVAPVPITGTIQDGCFSKLGSCLSNIDDYIDAEIAPNGRLYVIYVDGCQPTCATKSSAVFVAAQT